MFWDFELMQFSPFVQFRQKYKTSKQHSLAAILKNRQLVSCIFYRTETMTNWF